MKKVINDPEQYVAEALEGLICAHPGVYAQSGKTGRVIVRRTPKPAGKVGVASGGGFGHLPLFAGYVGEGFLDACAVGDVFAGPSMDSVGEALRAADRGAGVLAVIGNYGGDKMAFAMAADLLEAAAIPVETVIVADDVASAPPHEAGKRRGVAGVVLAFKVAGAAAEAGWPLARVAAAARRAVERCRSIGVAVSSCVIPTRGQPTFELDHETIEMGMGIHGEQGVWRGALPSADALADEMLDRLTADQALPAGTRVGVLCNSLGATPIEELYILFRRVAHRLRSMDVTIQQAHVGHYATSMEMAGASLSILALDDELCGLMEAPSACPFWRAP